MWRAGRITYQTVSQRAAVTLRCTTAGAHRERIAGRLKPSLGTSWTGLARGAIVTTTLLSRNCKQIVFNLASRFRGLVGNCIKNTSKATTRIPAAVKACNNSMMGFSTDSYDISRFTAIVSKRGKVFVMVAATSSAVHCVDLSLA